MKVNLREGPIHSVVDLSRSFSPEEWRHAAHIAADDTVETVCTLLARLSSRDERPLP